jgi:thiol-disulfide isomerase/thioredoxin
MNTRRNLILLAAFVVTLSVASVAVWTGVRYYMRVDAGLSQPEPNDETVTLRFFRDPAVVAAFTARDLDGQSISSADWRGKVTIVNFWATWCGPCRAEIPELIALQEKYRDRLQIIGVSVDEVSPDIVKRFAADQKVNYPVVMTTPEIQRAFPGVTALPTSFVVDREVRVVQKHTGLLNAVTAENETRALSGLSVNASIEQVDRFQPVKLENAAQVTSIPGVELASLSPDRRLSAIQKLNSEGCTCGCDLTVAKCRVDDPSCSISLPLARKIVQQITDQP